MSKKLVQLVLEQDVQSIGLSPAEHHVLLYLAWRADKANNCWPSIATVSRNTGYSRTSIIRIIKQLVKKKVLTRKEHEDKSGRQTTNRLHIIVKQGGTLVQKSAVATLDDIEAIDLST